VPTVDSAVVFPLVLGLMMAVPAGWMGRLNSQLRRKADDAIAAADAAAEGGTPKPRPDYDAMARFYAWAYRSIGIAFIAMAAWNLLTRR
jgi:hypothetical protein